MKDRKEILWDLIGTYGLSTVIEDISDLCRETAREEAETSADWPSIAEQWNKAADALDVGTGIYRDVV